MFSGLCCFSCKCLAEVPTRTFSSTMGWSHIHHLMLQNSGWSLYILLKLLLLSVSSRNSDDEDAVATILGWWLSWLIYNCHHNMLFCVLWPGVDCKILNKEILFSCQLQHSFVPHYHSNEFYLTYIFHMFNENFI